MEVKAEKKKTTLKNQKREIKKQEVASRCGKEDLRRESLEIKKGSAHKAARREAAVVQTPIKRTKYVESEGGKIRCLKGKIKSDYEGHPLLSRKSTCERMDRLEFRQQKKGRKK